jgi:hypothetical protein
MAGIIDSRKGNASVAPAPCKNVRRERCFLLINIPAPSKHISHHKATIILERLRTYLNSIERVLENLGNYATVPELLWLCGD